MISALIPLSVLLASVAAFDDISIASSVEAGTEVTVEITNDIADGSRSFDAGFTNFNLYLSLSPPGWGTGPVCLLANGTKIDTTSVKIKIPADVVPADADLQITSMEWNSDPTKDGPSGFEYSNDFTLEGATGTWSKTELKGETVGDMDRLPCSALSCARKCSDKYYDERHKDENDINSYKNTYECIADCPGAVYPSWESIIADSNDSGDDSSSDEDSSSSSTATASETSTATAKASSAASTISTSVVGSSTPSASSSSSTEAASSPSATGGVGQVSVKTAGLCFAGLVAVYGLL